jgi:hypothetical protein
VLQNRTDLTDPEAPLHIWLLARLAIMPVEQTAARILRVFKNRPFLVRLVNLWSEIQFFVIGHSSPLLLSGMPPTGRIGIEEWD